MKKKVKEPRKKIVTVSGKFGSPFQKESAINSLMGMIRAWKDFYSSTHKKNDIKIYWNE